MRSISDHGDETYLYGETSPSLRSEATNALHRSSDTPLRPGITLREGTEEAMSLMPCQNLQIADARRCVLGNFVAQPSAGQWLFYSRDNNHYSQVMRYVPKFYRRDNIVAAVDDLERSGLIDHEKTAPSPSAWYRSRMRATDCLLSLVAPVHASEIQVVTREPIVLRDTRGRPVKYEDTDVTIAMREDVLEQNAFIETVPVTVDHPMVRYDETGFLMLNGARLCPTRKSAYRVFNENFSLGGRWYGPLWQSLPASLRKGIRLDGSETVEEDFRCCHLRLLFALAGDDLGDRDAYDGFGLPRHEVKLAIQVMLNANSAHGAAGAICHDLVKTHGPTAAARTRRLMGLVRTLSTARAVLEHRLWSSTPEHRFGRLRESSTAASRSGKSVPQCPR